MFFVPLPHLKSVSVGGFSYLEWHYFEALQCVVSVAGLTSTSVISTLSVSSSCINCVKTHCYQMIDWLILRNLFHI